MYDSYITLGENVMSTSMHRLQISLPRWQVQFLAERARRDKVSIAEIVRQMVQRESGLAPAQTSVESVLELAGIAEDRAPLANGVPVSEQPGRYITEIVSEKKATARKTRQAR